MPWWGVLEMLLAYISLRAGLLPEDSRWDEEAAEVEVTVQPNGLPMGFRNSCAVWTKTARVLTGMWRRRGL